MQQVIEELRAADSWLASGEPDKAREFVRAALADALHAEQAQEGTRDQ